MTTTESDLSASYLEVKVGEEVYVHSPIIEVATQEEAAAGRKPIVSSSSLPRPEPHIAVGGSHDQEEDGANADGWLDSMDQSLQQDEEEEEEDEEEEEEEEVRKSTQPTFR